VAGTVERGLGAKGAVRGKVEYMQFGDRNSQPTINYPGDPHNIVFFQGLKYDMKMVGLGADYLHGFRSNGAGLYVLGGIGYYITFGGGGLYPMFYYPITGHVMVGEPQRMDGHGNSMGASLGAGYRFTGNMACELRFTTLNNLTHETRLEAIEPISMRGGVKSPGDTYYVRSSYKIDLDWLQVSFCYRF